MNCNKENENSASFSQDSWSEGVIRYELATCNLVYLVALSLHFQQSTHDIAT